MNRLKYLSLGLISMAFSCTQDRVFEEFHAFESQSWNEKDSVSFELKEVKEKQGAKLIGVRFNETYPYSNFYIRIITEDSLGTILENKLLNVPLFDSKSGEPRGKGFGNTFTFYDTIPLDFSANTARIKLLQYMRQENIDGIEAVGIKIEK